MTVQIMVDGQAFTEGYPGEFERIFGEEAIGKISDLGKPDFEKRRRVEEWLALACNGESDSAARERAFEFIASKAAALGLARPANFQELRAAWEGIAAAAGADADPEAVEEWPSLLLAAASHLEPGKDHRAAVWGVAQVAEWDRGERQFRASLSRKELAYYEEHGDLPLPEIDPTICGECGRSFDDEPEPRERRRPGPAARPESALAAWFSAGVLAKLSPGAVTAFVLLVLLSDKTHKYSRGGRPRLGASAGGVDPSTVGRWLDELEEKGMIARTRFTDRVGGQPRSRVVIYWKLPGKPSECKDARLAGMGANVQ